MSPIKVVLLACGSFNPPTNMHLRMFEIARDYLQRIGNYVVVGGLISPVHDGYGKKDLVNAKHRLAMLKLSLQNTDWVKISEWECNQESWSRTKTTIQHHQNVMNATLNNTNLNEIDNDMLTWIPNNIKNGCMGPVQVKLLCGADLLESFGTPGLWADEDIDSIVGQHGLVVITREGANPLKFIYESDVLTKYMGNIQIVTEWITNEVSSTKIRRALRREESVKYLIPDNVIDYIQKHGLYGAKDNETKYINPYNTILNLLTPSPTDVVMESPSPTDNHCISICNNNLFIKSIMTTSTSSPTTTTLSSISPEHNYVSSIIGEAADTKNSINNSNFRHPGQAVKILTDKTGEHTVIRNNHEVRKIPNQFGVLKSSKSCTTFEQRKTELKTSRSNSTICDYQNCDENMIKFIFTKHGIQVISDIETVV